MRGMCSERRVVMPDGSVHVERTFGNVRYDLTTGLATTVISAPNSTMSQVVRPDGTVAMETVVGGVRRSTDGVGDVRLL